MRKISEKHSNMQFYTWHEWWWTKQSTFSMCVLGKLHSSLILFNNILLYLQVCDSNYAVSGVLSILKPYKFKLLRTRDARKKESRKNCAEPPHSPKWSEINLLNSYRYCWNSIFTHFLSLYCLYPLCCSNRFVVAVLCSYISD